MQSKPERAARPDTPPPVVDVDRVTKSYDDASEALVTAVDDLSLEIGSGEFLVISGRSGSGKTTLLNLMAGLAAPTSGVVRLNGVDLWQIPDSERSRIRNEAIGFVFQFPSLMPTLTVTENVMLPRVFGAKRRDPGLEARAVELLGLVGIAEKANCFPRQLSAGQQQRVVLARALINDPGIIMADEPTSNLDERTEAEMMELFRDVHRSAGVTIVMVTHAAALMSHGTRSVEMASGRLGADGPARDPLHI